MNSIDSLQRVLHENALDTRICAETRKELFHFYRQSEEYYDHKCFHISESQYVAGVVKRLRNRLKNLKT